MMDEIRENRNGNKNGTTGGEKVEIETRLVPVEYVVFLRKTNVDKEGRQRIDVDQMSTMKVEGK